MEWLGELIREPPYGSETVHAGPEKSAEAELNEVHQIDLIGRKPSTFGLRD